MSYHRCLVFILALATLPSLQAQLSSALQTGAQRFEGPYFLNDSLVVYSVGERLYAREGHAEVRQIYIDNNVMTIGRLIQAADGKVYAVSGGYCDVLQEIRSLFEISGTNADDVSVEEIVTFDLGERTAAPFVRGFDVSADGTMWLLAGQKAHTVSLSTGKVLTRDVAVGIETSTPIRLISVDSVRAYHATDDVIYAIDIRSSTPATLIRTGEILDATLNVDAVLVMDFEGLKSYDFNGVKTNLAAHPLPNTFEATFISNREALLRSQDSTITAWAFADGSASSRTYYPRELGWAIAGARRSASGEIALIGSLYDWYGNRLPDDVPPPFQGFYQYFPAGIPLPLYGPPASFEVDFGTATGFNGALVASYTIDVANDSDATIDSAVIRATGLFGVPCREYANLGTVQDVLPRRQQRARTPYSIYYSAFGGTVAVGESLNTVFAIAHVNGRPVRRTEVYVNEVITALRDITPGSDVKLYPTLATNTLTVEFEDPRQELLIIDALGRVAFRQDLDSTQTQITIDVSSFGESLHYLLLSKDTGTSVHPFTVQR